MRILIDIGHPAHVHYFKHFAKKMLDKGHQILFTCREKEFETELLTGFGFNFQSFGKKYKSILGKILGMIEFDLKEIQCALKFKPDIFLSSGSIYAAHASKILLKPHISLEDTGNLEQIRIYRPFTDVILTPKVIYQDLGPKQIRYNGYQELLYLHPNVYKKTESGHQILGLKKDERYVILRFVSWNASHDINQHGLLQNEKLKLIEFFASRYRVFVSCEGDPDPVINKYRLTILPHQIHTVLEDASFFVGEGATMAAEAGLLGTPSIYTNSIRISYIDDQEKNGTIFKLISAEQIMKKVLELEKIEDFKGEWQRKAKQLISTKIDVTALLVWFVEHFPGSIHQFLANPEFQQKFISNN